MTDFDGKTSSPPRPPPPPPGFNGRPQTNMAQSNGEQVELPVHVINALQMQSEKLKNRQSLTTLSLTYGALPGETDDERRKREEEENAAKNEMSLVRMFGRFKQQVLRDNQTQVHHEQVVHEILDEDYFSRDEFQRTTSMVSTGPGEYQVMSKEYKLVTSSVLWFCYFALALNDYIFGPTFDDLSKIMRSSFDKITMFAIIRQCAYTLGSLGGVAFNYINRQIALVILLLLSAVSLFATPYSSSLVIFYLIAAVNGFSAGACDVGFHVWILEMFQNGGGPLIQALHFSFGIGITIAPLISANFLSGESECDAHEAKTPGTLHNDSMTMEVSDSSIAEIRARLFIPYAITGSVVTLGGLILLGLFFYKRYIPPKERKLPVSFDEQMPKQLSRLDKLELWKKSVPSFYIMLIISLGSVLLLCYYGLEVTYLQFIAQFSTATPLPIQGEMSAHLEAATGGAYALGGLIATFVSFRVHPQNMIYLNFVLINVGSVILLVATYSSLPWFWVGNVVVGFGFSSCYATAYTFLEHQINVTNLIGSIFLFAGGLGTAIFPIFLSGICTNPIYLVYLALFAANMSLVLFITLHIMTQIRGKQIKLIKKQLLASPATLTQFKERTLSSLSYEPQ